MVNYPDDWTEIPLLDYVQLVQGLTYTPENVKPFGTLVLRSSNIKNGFLSLKDNVYVDCQIPDEKLIQCGDILICVRNGSPSLIGKSCVLKKMPRTTFGAFMSILRGDKTGYISKLWGHDIIQRQVRGNSSATINQITKKDFKNIIIPIPTTQTEQTAIATALSDMDSLIYSLRQLIAKKKNIQKGLMKKLFAPNAKKMQQKRDDFVRLSDVCSITAKMVDPRFEEYLYLPHIGNESIEKHTGRLLQYNTVKDDDLISGKYYFSEKDVLYGKINPQFGKVAFPQFSGLCSADMYPITCGKNICPQFLKWLLLTESFLRHTMSQSQRSGMPKVNRGEIFSFKFFLPNIHEQKSIVEILEDVDDDINSLESKLQKYENIKKGMMEKLLTGQIRLV